MQPPRRRAHAPSSLLLLCVPLLGLAGCASPGPPRPPSLQIPRLVSDLQVTRSGDTVIVRFTVPARTTDGLPLHAATVNGSLCRQVTSDGPCVPVDMAETRTPLAVPGAADAPPVLWTDPLPPALTVGAPRPVAYRVALRNPAGRSAGLSDPAYAAGGTAPPPVSKLQAEPMRLGVQLTWQPIAGAGEVLLERTEPVPAGTAAPATPAAAPTTAHGKTRGKAPVSSTKTGAKTGGKSSKGSGTPGRTVLQASPGDPGAAMTVDAGIAEGVPYTYMAFRRVPVQLGGHALQSESAPSSPVTVVWHDVYPPAKPIGLTALGYRVPAGATAEPEAAKFAVDLVWQPVNDPRLTGYLVYRQTLNAAGAPAGPRVQLTAEPLLTTGFHDATAGSSARYRYSVTATDAKGNQSAGAETVVDPATR